MLLNAIKFNVMQCNVIQCDTMQYKIHWLLENVRNNLVSILQVELPPTAAHYTGVRPPNSWIFINLNLSSEFWVLIYKQFRVLWKRQMGGGYHWCGSNNSTYATTQFWLKPDIANCWKWNAIISFNEMLILTRTIPDPPRPYAAMCFGPILFGPDQQKDSKSVWLLNLERELRVFAKTASNLINKQDVSFSGKFF